MTMKRSEQWVTALLPMKGHSERVPGKNIRDFCGEPLFFRVLKTLDTCPSIRRILVNTDSEAIAEMARRQSAKVQVVWRPEALCGDFVAMNDILAYDLAYCEGEHVLQTHSTNPLLRPETVETAIRDYFNGLDRHDSLFSVTEWKTRLYWVDGDAVNHNPEELIRTQDLPPIYEENSNLFIFSKQSFQAAGNRRIGCRPIMFPMHRLEAVDIDEEADFVLAEALYARGER